MIYHDIAKCAGVPWVSGNDALAPKPCLNPGSSSDEDFTGSKTASLAAVFVYNFLIFKINFLFFGQWIID